MSIVLLLIKARFYIEAFVVYLYMLGWNKDLAALEVLSILVI